MYKNISGSFPIEYLGKVGSDRVFISPRHCERSIDRSVLRHACLSRERGGLKLAISTVIATCSGDASTPPTLQRRQRPCVRIVQEQWAKRNIDDAAAAWLSVRERANACMNSRLYTGCLGVISLHYLKSISPREKKLKALVRPINASLIFVNDLLVKYFDTWVPQINDLPKLNILGINWKTRFRNFVLIYIYILLITDRYDLIGLKINRAN